MQEQQNHQHYKVDLPYPQVQPGCDPQAVTLLLEDYSGMTSELTAILQYFYGSIQLRCQWEEAYQALKYISIVEMHHMDLLGQAILAKGGDPRLVLRGGRKPQQPWCSSAVAYDKCPCNVLLNSIQGERTAIAQYQRQIQCLQDESTQALLRRIVLDEELHLQIFADLYRKCQHGMSAK